MNIRLIFILLLSFLLFSCKEYTPKPKGYPLIEKVDDSLLTYTYKAFSFQYSSHARITEIPSEKETEKWINIHYPNYEATIYCSYMPISKALLRDALEDSHRIAYSHATQANNIIQTLFNESDLKNGGIIYDIEGSVASPIQFFLTDSISNFFRGSVYYDNKINPDSVAPITSFLREDVIHIMKSMEWRSADTK